MSECESQLEADFLYDAKKYTHCDIAVQVPCPTPWGEFRVDFVFDITGEKVAVECDGKDFHDLVRDEWRDAAILGSGLVNEIVRLRGCDLYYRAEDCLFVLMQWHPRLFSDRGRINLGILADERVSSAEFIDLHFLRSLERGKFISIQRRTACRNYGRQYWRSLYEKLLARPSARLDDVAFRNGLRPALLGVCLSNAIPRSSRRSRANCGSQGTDKVPWL